MEKITAAGQVHYFYDEGGNVIVERDQSGATLKDTVYMGGQHVAEFSGGRTYFVHTDDLGSTRTVTDYAGNVTDALDYLPFGEQIAGDTFTTHKFTGKERDSESGLDNFGARYMSSQYGRFMTPDWSEDPDPIPYGNIADPQTFNLYSYVRNNPINKVDPDGHCYPLCTVLAGAGIGAVAGALTEMGAEVLRGEPINARKIENAAVAGAITGGIIGLAPESAPAALQVGMSIAGNVVGGAAERGLNGEPVADARAVLGDAGAGLISGRIDIAAGRQMASPLVRKGTATVLDAIIDAGRRATGSGPNKGTSSNPSGSSTVPLNPNLINQIQTQGTSSSSVGFGANGFEFLGYDEFDLMQLQQQQNQACVTTDDGLGNVTTTCY